MSDDAFAARIRERFPEGLTAVFAIGGTRTTYILERNREVLDPGRIDAFSDYGDYLIGRYWDMARMFFELGGQNLIVTAFSFRGFHERGPDYGDLIAQEMRRLIDERSAAFYRENDIDPYFTGVDTLLLLPDTSLGPRVGRELLDFQRNWTYREGRYKLIWEMASIPLYSFWRLHQDMSGEERSEFDAELAAQATLVDLHRLFYRRFARAVYGTDIPMPHFYLGTNKSGDLKWRSPMPIALTGGDYVRMFYTPYPSLFTTRETLKTILEDVAFKDRFYSNKADYSGKYTPDLVQAEYERVMELCQNPETTVGLSRRVAPREPVE